MLYKFETPVEYEKFLSMNGVTGAFSTLDMEVFIPEIKKIRKKGLYLEIGVDRGLSLLTAFFAAKEGVNIVGVDIVDTPERIEAFKNFDLVNYVEFIHGESTAVAKTWRRPIDVLFIDGDHSYGAVLKDIKSWSKFVKKGGCILFHDCDESSPGVVKAVNESFPKSRIKLFKKPNKNTSMAKVQM